MGSCIVQWPVYQLIFTDAEERAAAHLSKQEREAYLSLSNIFYDALLEETASIRKGGKNIE